MANDEEVRMNGKKVALRIGTGTLAAGVWMAGVSPAGAGHLDFTVFNDRASYSGVLLQQGRVQVDDDWNESGEIQEGQSWGPFRFAFDPAVSRLAGTTGIVGGLAIGSATGNGNLGGDQGMTLHLSPGLGVTAFGALIAFEDPAFLSDFHIAVGCPDPPCLFSPTPPQGGAAGPGTFFLGIVAPVGFSFDTVMLEAVTPRDDSGEPTATVPGWQVAGISYAPMPEPATLALVGLGLTCLGVVIRRRYGNRRPIP